MKSVQSNFERMMDVIEETFAMRSDKLQLQVDESVLKRLNEIHPSTLLEYNEGNGPLVWVLVIPTSEKTMNDFINEKITEQQLFEQTKPGINYEAIYLCSATALPECRRKGHALRLCCEAINSICQTNDVKKLYVWSFTKEGEVLAEKIAVKTGISLWKRKRAGIK